MAITISGTTLTYNDGSTDTTDTENTTAGLSAGAIGSYAQLMFPGNNAFRTPGYTIAGSSLRYATAGGQTGTPTAPTTPGGSWRLMGELPSVFTPPFPTPKGTGGGTTAYTTTSVWLRYA
jgi:hypothetical protein